MKGGTTVELDPSLRGIEVTRTNYTQMDHSGGFVDIFVTSNANQELRVIGSGFNSTSLDGQNGLYYARVYYVGEQPPKIFTVSNDDSTNIRECEPIDFISAIAIYQYDTNILAISAKSSDQYHPIQLTVQDFGMGEFVIPDEGVISLSLLNIPLGVTIVSTGGGVRTIPVEVVGPDNTLIGVTANAGKNQTVAQGATVKLTGTAIGHTTSFRWEQITGPPVQLTSVDSPITMFTFPMQLTTLKFKLTVTGPTGSSTDQVEISTFPNQLSITRAEYRSNDKQWIISGTSNIVGPNVKVKIYNGHALNGIVLAEVEVNELGVWEYQNTLSLQPNVMRAISIQSSAGGTLINVPLNVRN